MKPRTRFLKMYNKLPEEAKMHLIYGYPDDPMSLRVVALEVEHKTKLSELILRDLGYKDD